ncbi:hypothetical protein LTR08_003724 [Meristemomyces frigidus]|nr:hypothetical protein LTR08_003724 [Meristemomyces frigidus]
MVDLPGLFRAGNKDQSVDDATTVRQMVKGYMTRPRSIILAVVSAKSDFALQEVTELARELDPRGIRTLGLITKPDTLDAGSDSETAYIKLAQNKDVIFRLGWHVLKNRNYEMRHASSAERDENEMNFFATGIWTFIDPTCLGVKSLKHRLSNVLKNQILRQLPSLLRDVEAGILACHTRLKHLGNPRATLVDQHRYLLRPFLWERQTEEGYQRRLRAVVQNMLTDFEESMRLEGEARIVVDTPRNRGDLGPRETLRLDYVEEVKQLMRKSRGCELPGTFNPLIIGELFTEQCQPWRGHAAKAKDNILQAANSAMTAIIDHTAVDETSDGLLHIISQGMDTLRFDLNRKVAELLEPHFDVHPITFNHYLTDNVQKAQSSRRRRSFELTLKDFFGINNLEGEYQYQVRPFELLKLLDQRTEADMESYASELATDYMGAYYKVALKRISGASTSTVQSLEMTNFTTMKTEERTETETAPLQVWRNLL